MRCPNCKSSSLTVREWEICYYDAYYYDGEVVDAKHRDTAATGYERASSASCDECLLTGDVVRFLEKKDRRPSVPIIQLDRAPRRKKCWPLSTPKRKRKSSAAAAKKSRVRAPASKARRKRTSAVKKR